jgi:hypothetical protein
MKQSLTSLKEDPGSNIQIIQMSKYPNYPGQNIQILNEIKKHTTQHD